MQNPSQSSAFRVRNRLRLNEDRPPRTNETDKICGHVFLGACMACTVTTPIVAGVSGAPAIPMAMGIAAGAGAVLGGVFACFKSRPTGPQQAVQVSGQELQQGLLANNGTPEVIIAGPSLVQAPLASHRMER